MYLRHGKAKQGTPVALRPSNYELKLFRLFSCSRIDWSFLHFENMISHLLGLIWLISCVFAQDDDASPTVVQNDYGSTKKLRTITEPTGTETSASTSSAANTNITHSASSAYIIRIVIIVAICIVFIPCRLLLRRYRRNGYFFRPPKKPERKAIDAHPGIAKVSQGGYHETTELMAEGSPGEMGLSGHHETVEIEGSLSQQKKMAAAGLTSMKWGTTI
ncbi:hypothetical protein BOTCAL_0189g00170 [Botryotinia calthae]|uniref:Uncharacterized protein n=1 Tax=Botryotinia calthae TaxID=38488 RepID=A0A4Y8D066_9HELO|nr:hypothetical protein BOTCAL_0189g00170 [Botryotinia calthae]